MKNLILAALLLTSSVTWAQYGSVTSYSGDKSLTALIGFTQSALNFGANFEKRASGPLGYGGFFHFSTEKKDDTGKRYNNYQTISFGGLMYMHLLESSDLDVYLAPGAGIAMVKGIKGTITEDDQTLLAPIWKIGAFYKYSTSLKFGLEQTQLVNWFTDKAVANIQYTNFAIAWIL